MKSNQPQGFLALPHSGRGYPVLVLHAWWGLNETMKAFCQRLAEAGFVVFAPDLYQGRVTDDIAEAESLSGALFENLGLARAEVAAAGSFLGEHPAGSGRGLAVVGFSLGAFFALDLSASDPERVESVVVFYGTRPGEYGKAKANYLGHFAENDAFEPAIEVDSLEASLRRARRPVRFYRYPGTGHWFFEAEQALAYDAGAAGLAWERTLAFLKEAEGGLGN